MPVKDRATLRTAAQLIRDETVADANTALRVGGTVEDIVDSVLLSDESVATIQATAASDSNIASLNGLATTVDGRLMSTDDEIVLLTAQSTGAENGPWHVHSGAWTRPVNYAAGNSAAGTFVRVVEGTDYGDTTWRCTTDPPNDVVDTDATAWSTTVKLGPGDLLEFAGTAVATIGHGSVFSGTMEVTNDGTGTVGFEFDQAAATQGYLVLHPPGFGGLMLLSAANGNDLSLSSASGDVSVDAIAGAVSIDAGAGDVTYDVATSFKHEWFVNSVSQLSVASSLVKVTQGVLAVGGTVSTTGAINLANDLDIYFRNAADTADVALLVNNTSNNVFLGDATNSPNVRLRASSQIIGDIGGAAIWITRSSELELQSGIKLDWIGTAALSVGGTNWLTFTSPVAVLPSSILEFGGTAADTGNLRGPSNFSAWGRNAADTANIRAFAFAADILYLGDNSTGNTVLNAASASAIQFRFGGSTVSFDVDSGGANLAASKTLDFAGEIDIQRATVTRVDSTSTATRLNAPSAGSVELQFNATSHFLFYDADPGSNPSTGQAAIWVDQTSGALKCRTSNGPSTLAA